MISVSSGGSTRKVESFIDRMRKGEVFKVLEQYAEEGLSALTVATPVDTGLTADSWSYEVTQTHGRYSIAWRNLNLVEGVPVAILIQYGHGTNQGVWIQGRDYINPIMQPLFDELAEKVWKEVTRNG